jgi:UDP-2-acetamido-3-amino-2,3-dideoxy-glucuronate N-acetyltransferase
MNYFVHELADVKSGNIGKDTKIWQFSIVLSGAIIGENCNINCHCFIENDVVMGNNVTVKSGVYLWDGIHIDDDVFIGPNVSFTNNKYPRSKHFINSMKTHIGKGASIGAGSSILCELSVGEYAMIGAGSVITKNVPPYTLWFGNPASQKGFVTEDGELLNMNMVSKNGTKYHMVQNKIRKI